MIWRIEEEDEEKEGNTTGRGGDMNGTGKGRGKGAAATAQLLPLISNCQEIPHTIDIEVSELTIE